MKGRQARRLIQLASPAMHCHELVFMRLVAKLNSALADMRLL
jgi:hypothetical protein